MKLIRKAKDERVVAEINRIYKVGFYFLTAGILADLVLQVLGISVQNETIGGAVNLVEFAVVMLAQLFCIVLMARKGMMDDNAFAEAVCYPWKHYLVQGALGGVAASVVVCVLQCATGGRDGGAGYSSGVCCATAVNGAADYGIGAAAYLRFVPICKAAPRRNGRGVSGAL